MKVIGSISEVLSLPGDLGMFILESCPWMAEDWEPEIIGYVFVLDDRDINEVSSICTVPHIEDRESTTIDLATFDLWETPSIYDEVTGYWNVVAILGEEYGCAVFLSSGFVASIPSLQERLKAIHGMRKNGDYLCILPRN